MGAYGNGCWCEGRRAESPILLKLHGGPGQAEMATAELNGLLENDFVVVEWDQPGSGKSGAAIQPAEAMNVSQLVADTIELTEHLTQRFGRRKLIVVGHSWGSVLGLMAAQRRPDLFSAFVSTGLIANFAEGQQVAYGFLVAESRRRGNTKALTELNSLGSPPYGGTEGIAKWKRCARWLSEFGALWHSSEKFNRVGWMLRSIEYSWPEKLRFNRAAERSFDLLYADLLSVNLSETVPRVEVPVFFAEGRYDRVAPVEVAERYSRASSHRRRNWCGSRIRRTSRNGKRGHGSTSSSSKRSFPQLPFLSILPTCQAGNENGFSLESRAAAQAGYPREKPFDT